VGLTGGIIEENHAGTGDGMGIRFYCPNGHKLNVKDFQAGQTGICPFCGTKMQIPLQSTRPSSQEQKSRPQGGGAAASPGAAVIEAESPTAVLPIKPNGGVASSAAAPAAGQSTFAAAPAATAGAGDPLSAAGDVVWYVRPSSGGQFGPATADVMRAWLTEGRVSVDTLVWREGWRDWQEAGSVFSQLSPGSAVSGLDAILSEEIPVAIHPRPMKHPAPPRRMQAIVIGALVLAVLALLAVLLVILQNQ
jgi:hypothetical protein